MAALLSAIFPGLGQFYNGHVSKGLGFLVSAFALAALLLGMADLRTLRNSALQGIPPEGSGQILLISVLLLSLALWSIVDAAKASSTSGEPK